VKGDFLRAGVEIVVRDMLAAQRRLRRKITAIEGTIDASTTAEMVARMEGVVELCCRQTECAKWTSDLLSALDLTDSSPSPGTAPSDESSLAE
jgi:hypothetical protein